MILGGTARSPDDAAALIDMGLSFAEISVPDAERFRKDLPQYRALAEGAEFFYLCHGPQEGNPNDIESLEKSYLPRVLRMLDLVREIGSKTLTIHLWMDPRFVAPRAIHYKVGFLKRVVQVANRSHININIENLSESHRDFLPVFDAIPELGMTLDLGHAQLLTSRNRAFGFIAHCPERIRHIHLHDNNGGASAEDDLHLPIGQGKVDFLSIFASLKTINYNGTMTLELRPEQIRACLNKVVELLVSACSSEGDLP